MRFACFRQYPEFEKFTKDHKFKFKYGFYPLPVFPANTIEEALINAILEVPDIPDRLQFFDTDQYVKIENHEEVGRAKYFIDRNATPVFECCVYDYLQVYPGDAQITDMDKEKTFHAVWKEIMDSMPNAAHIYQYHKDYIRYCNAMFLDVEDIDRQSRESGRTSGSVASQMVKYDFVCAALPFIYTMLEKADKDIDVLSELRLVNAPALLEKELYKAVSDYCYTKGYSEADYNRLYQELKEIVSTPYGALLYKADRNSACPCGSGKKYKNCCEKYRQIVFPFTLIKEE